MECYDHVTDKWTSLSAPRQNRYSHCAVSLNEYLYVIGGKESPNNSQNCAGIALVSKQILSTATVTYSFHSYSRSSHHFILSLFHSFYPLMNSINWPASMASVWVFIAQLVEHCSANAEATGSNPVEAPKNFFSGYFAIA